MVVVVLAPTGDRLERARQLAESRALRGDRVVLVGPGATLTSERAPEGVERRELGDYREQSTLAATKKLRDALYNWLDATFREAFGPYLPRDVIGPYAQLRLLGSERMEQLATLTDLYLLHASDEVIIVEPDLWESTLAKSFTIRPRARQSVVQRLREAGVRARFVAVAVAGIAVTATSIARDELLGQPTRDRSSTRPAARPVWLALTPDWARFNAHVIRLAEHVRADRLGLMVFPPLEPSELVEPLLARRRTPSSWNAVAPLSEHVPASSCFALSSWGSSRANLVVKLCATSSISARVVLRVAFSAGWVPFGSGNIPLSLISAPLARLCTIDVARARRSFDAAHELVAQTDFSQATVVFAKSNTADATPLHLVLRSHGARTIDYFHGWTGEAIPLANESPASMRLVWSNTDAAEMRPGQRAAVLVDEPGSQPAQRASRTPRNILLLTNYAHRDVPARDRAYRALLQREILDAVVLCHQEWPELNIRWRPHPADLENLLKGAPASISRSADTLDNDLQWADAAICSVSTTILAALKKGLPTFIHVLPERRASLSWVARERGFFRAGELKLLLASYLAQCATNSIERESPELRMWTAHFGGELIVTADQLLGHAELAPHRVKFVDVPSCGRH